MKAEEILDALDNPSAASMRSLETSVEVDEVIRALASARNDFQTELLCDLLGRIQDPIAVSALTSQLKNTSAEVRSSAADSLAKIAAPESGPAIMDAFEIETDDGVRQMLALALGTTLTHRAEPLLRTALTSDSSTLRGCAAWSLGHLRDRDSVDALSEARRTERDAYALRQIDTAIAAIAASAPGNT